jgi:hypothetical protein
MIPLITIITHYTDLSYKNRTVLIAVKRLNENYSKENIAALLIQIIKKFGFENRLGYFITNNTNLNNVCINLTLKQLLPYLSKTERSQRRLRCYGHILNLACITYLYGHEAESFEAEHMVNEILAREEEDLKAWRRFGPLGKLHNLIVWIRRSDQRRTLFL